jgi:hypothetical protein
MKDSALSVPACLDPRVPTLGPARGGVKPSAHRIRSDDGERAERTLP